MILPHGVIAEPLYTSQLTNFLGSCPSFLIGDLGAFSGETLAGFVANLSPSRVQLRN